MPVMASGEAGALLQHDAQFIVEIEIFESGGHRVTERRGGFPPGSPIFFSAALGIGLAEKPRFHA